MLYYYCRNFPNGQPDFPNMLILQKLGGLTTPPIPPLATALTTTPNMAVNQNSSQNAWLRKYLYITAISSQRDYLLVLRNKKVLCPVCGKTSAIFSIQGLQLHYYNQCMKTTYSANRYWQKPML